MGRLNDISAWILYLTAGFIFLVESTLHQVATLLLSPLCLLLQASLVSCFQGWISPLLSIFDGEVCDIPMPKKPFIKASTPFFPKQNLISDFLVHFSTPKTSLPQLQVRRRAARVTGVVVAVVVTSSSATSRAPPRTLSGACAESARTPQNLGSFGLAAKS